MIIRVPVSLLPNAQRDLENFIRDIACITQRGINPFIRRKRKIRQAVKLYKNPFDPARKQFDPNFICKDNFMRWMHIDLGQNRDAVGISMAHVPRFVDRERWIESPNDKDKIVIQKVKVPEVTVDFWGRISVRKGEEIVLGEIRELVYELSRRHFYFGLITFDRFQSLDSIQILRSYGYRTGHLSIDRTHHYLQIDNDNELGYVKRSTEGNTNAAHQGLKDLLYDDRINFPDSMEWYDKDWLVVELEEAQEDMKSGKIDHPPSGTIDVEQSVAGSVFHCINNEKYIDITQSEMDEKAVEDDFYRRTENLIDNSLVSIYQDIGTTQDPREIGII